MRRMTYGISNTRLSNNVRKLINSLILLSTPKLSVKEFKLKKLEGSFLVLEPSIIFRSYYHPIFRVLQSPEKVKMLIGYVLHFSLNILEHIFLLYNKLHCFNHKIKLQYRNAQNKQFVTPVFTPTILDFYNNLFVFVQYTGLDITLFSLKNLNTPL